MRPRIITVVLACATLAGATGCLVDTYYGPDDFGRDVTSAGWKVSDKGDEERFYQEALEACQAAQAGNPQPMNTLRGVLEANKHDGLQPSSANVGAYLRAAKRTCGLE